MSIFDKLNPVRTMDKINTNQFKQKLSTSVWESGKKTANLFDINDHSVILNGYNTNPYVYAVVNRLAMLMASVPIKVQKVTNEKSAYKYKHLTWTDKATNDAYKLKADAYEDYPESPLQELLDRPNKQDGEFEFRFNFYVNKLVTGNSFIEAIRPTPGRKPVEIWNLPPLSVSINESNNFYDKILEVYFNWGVVEKTIPKELIMHSKYYNPDGSVWGLSPISAARRAVNMINDGEEWNLALIQNGAKPEYVLVVAPGTPSDEKEKLKKRFRDNYTGPKQAGKDPLVIDEDFMKFETLGYTVKDMDWSNTELSSMRKVYDVYGVGSEIFNDPENKIQSNKKEAIRSLYTDKVLPEVQSFVDELNRWLVPMFGDESLLLGIDLSGVDALNEEKDKVATRMAQSWWLTLNEKREEMGFEAIEDELFNEPWLPMNIMPFSDIGLNPFTEEDEKALLKEYSNGKD